MSDEVDGLGFVGHAQVRARVRRSIDTLCAHLQWIATDLLGDRVSWVRVEARDHDYLIGIGIEAPEGWRHAVGGLSWVAAGSPVQFAEAACEKLGEWLDAKAADAAGGA